MFIFKTKREPKWASHIPGVLDNHDLTEGGPACIKYKAQHTETIVRGRVGRVSKESVYVGKGVGGCGGGEGRERVELWRWNRDAERAQVVRRIEWQPQWRPAAFTVHLVACVNRWHLNWIQEVVALETGSFYM